MNVALKCFLVGLWLYSPFALAQTFEVASIRSVLHGDLAEGGWSTPTSARFRALDRTGITRPFDIHLKYASSVDDDSALPTLFTALRETCGLELKSAKVPAPFLVIDHIDRVPTDN